MAAVGAADTFGITVFLRNTPGLNTGRPGGFARVNDLDVGSSYFHRILAILCIQRISALGSGRFWADDVLQH